MGLGLRGFERSERNWSDNPLIKIDNAENVTLGKWGIIPTAGHRNEPKAGRVGNAQPLVQGWTGATKRINIRKKAQLKIKLPYSTKPSLLEPRGMEASPAGQGGIYFLEGHRGTRFTALTWLSDVATTKAVGFYTILPSPEGKSKGE